MTVTLEIERHRQRSSYFTPITILVRIFTRYFYSHIQDVPVLKTDKTSCYIGVTGLVWIVCYSRVMVKRLINVYSVNFIWTHEFILFQSIIIVYMVVSDHVKNRVQSGSFLQTSHLFTHLQGDQTRSIGNE